MVAQAATLAHPTEKKFGNGQEVCFGLSRPDPGTNSRGQHKTRTGRHGPPHLGPGWVRNRNAENEAHGESGWDLDGPRIGPRRGSGWHPPRDSSRRLGLSEKCHRIILVILGARRKGRTATQCSKKGSEKVLGRVLGKGFSEGF